MKHGDSKTKEMAWKQSFFSASYDRLERAGVMNERENARLEKQYRNIETLRNNRVKEHTAEKNRVKSHMENLRKTVQYRAHSVDNASLQNGVRLPKLPNHVENGRKISRGLHLSRSVPNMQLIKEESEGKPTQFPVISTNNTRGKTSIASFKSEEIKGRSASSSFCLPARAQSHGELRLDRLSINEVAPVTAYRSVKPNITNVQNNLTTSENVGEKLYKDVRCCQEVLNIGTLKANKGFTAQRRNLGTGNVHINERINSFLETVEGYRISSSESEDED